MADAPWRCSQCGTVNEPAANACRRCGRWPSLFDLEQGTVDAESDGEPESAPWAVEETYVGEPTTVEEPTVVEEPPRQMETRAPAPDDTARVPEAKWPGPEPSIPNLPAGTWVRRLSRVAIPI